MNYSREVDAITMAFAAGMLPTEDNARLMTNLYHLGGALPETQPCQSPSVGPECESNASGDLSEMIHLACGLPPATTSTNAAVSAWTAPQPLVASPNLRPRPVAPSVVARAARVIVGAVHQKRDLNQKQQKTPVELPEEMLGF